MATNGEKKLKAFLLSGEIVRMVKTMKMSSRLMSENHVYMVPCEIIEELFSKADLLGKIVDEIT